MHSAGDTFPPLLAWRTIEGKLDSALEKKTEERNMEWKTSSYKTTAVNNI